MVSWLKKRVMDMEESKATIWRILFYVSLVMVAFGLVLLAIPFLTTALFDFPNYGTGQRALVVEVPSSGVYIVEAQVLGIYWRSSDSLDVEVISMSRPLLIIGTVISMLGVVTLAGVLIMLRRHKITVY